MAFGQKSNRKFTVRTSAAISADYASPVLRNDGDYLGIRFYIDVTGPSSLNMVPSIDVYDQVSQKWTQLIVGTAITAATPPSGPYVVEVYPSTDVAGKRAATSIGRDCRLFLKVSAGSATAVSVGGEWIQ